ncbi:MAG: response regulator, partial [Bacteroidota bacterium]
MKVLIVEDEQVYAGTLEMFLDQLGYEVSGICANGKDALESFHASKPDLVLMDIHLKGDLSGIDLARIFQGHSPIPIIFITAYDDPETFNQAKKTTPFAYLIKPFKSDELQRCIELALQQTYNDGEEAFSDANQVLLAKQSFFVKDRSRLHKVNMEDILWIEVEDKYCMLHVGSRKFLLRQSLKELADKLDPATFVQTHRS